jgi:hypothetical protein
MKQQKMSETRILVRLLRMYFPRNWEFGSALSKLWNFGGGGVEPPNPPGYATADFWYFDVRYNNISVSISSSESDSELSAMSSAIAHFARLQGTTSQYALTLCHAVFPMLRFPALRPAASQYVRSHCVTQYFSCCVSLPCSALPCVHLISMCARP